MPKKKQDFLQLGSQAADQSTSQLEPETTCDLSLNYSDSHSSCSNQPVNLSTRKRTHSTSRLETTDTLQPKLTVLTHSQSCDSVSQQMMEHNNIPQTHLLKETISTFETTNTITTQNNNDSSTEMCSQIKSTKLVANDNTIPMHHLPN